MKKIFSIVGFVTVTLLSFAQTDRYPIIQSPNETSAIIAWNTSTAGVGTVQWGTVSGQLTNTLTESASTKVHSLSVTGLQPNTKYYYKASSGSFTSSEEYFYTAKPDSVRQLDFVVYGDCGFNSSQQDGISSAMAAQNHDFGLVVGDVDQYTGNDYDGNYFSHYVNILKHTCHFTAIGNHDILTNNTNYTDAFILPHNNPANSELYYSFTWGNAKFIAIDGNIDYTSGSAQYTWLESELKCNDREWTFVYFHQPPWTNDWDASYYIPFTPFFQYQGNTDMRTSIVPLFEQYGVDFVLNGHAHDYQSGSYHGVHYNITGGGGASSFDSHTNSNSPNISYEKGTNNYMKFSINGDVLHYNTYDLNGAIIDSVTVTKTFTPYNANVTTVDAPCTVANGGKAYINVAGPHAPYTFNWSSGSTVDSAVQLTAGTYQVTITDANGCLKYASAVINQSSPLNIAGNVVNATCPNSTDGTVGLTVTGGTGPYNYLWPNGVNPNALTTGDYTVTVTDAVNCSGTQQYHIASNGGNVSPVITAANNTICAGDSALLTADAGYSNYLWNNGSATSSTEAYTAGLYYVTATDGFGCTVLSDTVLIAVDTIVHQQLGAITNQLNVQLNAFGSGFTSYTWNMGDGTVITDSTTHVTYTYAQSGTYYVTLVATGNCGNDTVRMPLFITGTVTGLNTITNGEPSIELMPNPLHQTSVIKILNGGAATYHLQVYGVDGKLVRDLGTTTTGNSLLLDRKDLSAGVYFLNTTAPGYKSTIRFSVD